MAKAHQSRGRRPPAPSQGAQEHRVRRRPHQELVQQHHRVHRRPRRQRARLGVGRKTSGSRDRASPPPFAAQLAAESCAKKAMEHGVRRVDVLVRGPGSGRETAIRSLAAAGIEVAGIKDVTPIPHNGCRPKKRRRV